MRACVVCGSDAVRGQTPRCMACRCEQTITMPTLETRCSECDVAIAIAVVQRGYEKIPLCAKCSPDALVGTMMEQLLSMNGTVSEVVPSATMEIFRALTPKSRLEATFIKSIVVEHRALLQEAGEKVMRVQRASSPLRRDWNFQE